MTSAIDPPRRFFAPCSPITQASASTTFDLPEPLGPTMQVTPGSNCERGRLREGLEALERQALQVHAGVPLPLGTRLAIRSEPRHCGDRRSGALRRRIGEEVRADRRPGAEGEEEVGLAQQAVGARAADDAAAAVVHRERGRGADRRAVARGAGGGQRPTVAAASRSARAPATSRRSGSDSGERRRRGAATPSASAPFAGEARCVGRGPRRRRARVEEPVGRHGDVVEGQRHGRGGVRRDERRGVGAHAGADVDEDRGDRRRPRPRRRRAAPPRCPTR